MLDEIKKLSNETKDIEIGLDQIAPQAGIAFIYKRGLTADVLNWVSSLKSIHY